MDFKNGVKHIKTAGYNVAGTVVTFYIWESTFMVPVFVENKFTKRFSECSSFDIKRPINANS